MNKTAPTQAKGASHPHVFASRHIDSTIWNLVPLRADDIIVGSYAKSGTTWLQTILCRLVHGPSACLDISELSPWVESRHGEISNKLSLLKRQQHRRVLKTHLPLNSLVWDARVRYVYIARDAVDVAWSLHHHHKMANDAWYTFLNTQDDSLGVRFQPPSGDAKRYFFEWLESDGLPFWPYRKNVLSWWHARFLDNVFLLHFKNLKTEFRKTVKKLAMFLEIEIDAGMLNWVESLTKFDHMRAHAELYAPNSGRFWSGGAETFFHKGEDGLWRSSLSGQEFARYQRLLQGSLGPSCSRWIRTGHDWNGLGWKNAVLGSGRAIEQGPTTVRPWPDRFV
ncbi:sulfotransferase domain-containing protein [Thiococcus pfennigii]|uniref:sulfotransferase domain-containing protein n=1 Tax=Thiococcus pfennigii TaxID=1057 RepID=UPI0019080BA8|nr:sulfotransferase domain-containing protein [Thiococcus pfennigii]